MDNINYQSLITVIGFILTCLFFVWITKKENITLTKKIKELEEIIIRVPAIQRDITNDRELIWSAKKMKRVTRIRMIGINSLGPVHQAREDIKELLNVGISVEILLLNPYSEEFERRVREVECKYKNRIEDFESHRQRLLAEYNATIAILQSIVKNIRHKQLLQVKLREEKPTFAFTAIISKDEKECKVLINEYPEKGRGTRGMQDLAHKAKLSEKVTYQEYIKKFDESWHNAKPLILVR